jgi:hypothetical protein
MTLKMNKIRIIMVILHVVYETLPFKFHQDMLKNTNGITEFSARALLFILNYNALKCISREK